MSPLEITLIMMIAGGLLLIAALTIEAHGQRRDARRLREMDRHLMARRD